jgi:hypothetical protein
MLIDQAIQTLASARLRKGLYWMRVRRQPIPPQLFDQIIQSQLWRQWGYGRLHDMLIQELGLDVERATDLTAQAIKGGFEDAKLYGC